MAVDITRNSLITAANANGGLTSTTTASATNTANALLILAVAYGDSGGAPAAPTVTGLSLTWVKIDNQEGGNVGFAFFRAMGAAATGALTITWAAGTDSGAWALCEFVGAQQTGTNGSGAIVQTQKTNAGSQTAVTMTFGSTPRTTSAIYAGIGHNDTTSTFTAGAASFTKRDDTNVGTPSLHLVTEDNMTGSATTTANINSTNAGAFGFIALEIAPLTVGLVPNANDAGAIASAEAFQNDAVISTADISQAGAIASAEAFGSPSISIEIDPVEIVSAEAFGVPFIESNVGVWPGFYIEVAFPNNAFDLDSAVTWTDVTSYCRSVHVARGRSREQDHFEPGTISVELDNRDMRFSPENSGSPYFPYVRPNKRVRVRASHNGHLVSLGNAYANSWSEKFYMPKDAVCILDATDAFKLFARYEIPDAWALAVTALNPTAWYRLDEKSGTSAYDTQRPGSTYAGAYTGTTTTTGAATGINQNPVQPGANTATQKATAFTNAATQFLTLASGVNPIPTTAGAATSITLRSSSKAYNLSDPVSLSVTKPAGATTGDILVAFVDIKGNHTLSTPSGWTAIRAAEASGSANGDSKLYSFWRLATASEAASYTFTQDGGGDIAAVITCWTGCDTTSPIDASGGSNATSGSTISAPSVTTTGANRMLVCGFGFNPGQTNTTVYSISPPSGMTEPSNGDTASQGNGSQVNNATVETAYLSVTTAGATGAKVATASGNSQHAGVSVALKPSASGAGAVPTPFTIAFWIQQSANQGNDDGYVEMGTPAGANSMRICQDIIATGTQKLKLQVGSQIVLSSAVIPTTGVPILVIGRYDGTTGLTIDYKGAGFSGRVTAAVTQTGLAASSLLIGVANLTMDEVAIWNTCLSNTQVDTLTAIATGVDTSSAVITALLNQIGWPSDLRQAQSTGAVTISNLTTGTTAGSKVLDYLQSINDTERGGLYMTGDGKLAYETLTFLQTDASRAVPAAYFGGVAEEIGYDDLSPDYSDQILVNDVQISNTTTDNGASASATESYSSQDADSILEFSRYTLSITTNYDAALATRQANAATRMAFELARYKAPVRRIESISIDGTSRGADWDTLLQMTMLQRVTVNHLGPDGTTVIAKDYTVRSFDWTYTASPKSVKLVLGLDEGAVIPGPNTVPNPSFETDTTGWANDTNATLTRVTTQKFSGTAAVQITATAGADAKISTPSGTSGIPVTIGTYYALSAWFKSAVTARSCLAQIRWYDSGGSLLSTSSGSTVTDSTSAWTESVLAVAAPASAAFAQIVLAITSPSAAEIHYADLIVLNTVS